MIYKSAHSKGATVEYKKLWYDRVKNREVIHDGTFIYKVLDWYCPDKYQKAKNNESFKLGCRLRSCYD